MRQDPAQSRDGGEVFHVVLIKPTHYDDLGYPIQFDKAPLPSNSLACMMGLARDAVARNILGDNVEIRVHAADEAYFRIAPENIIHHIRAGGGRALIGLVGVQTCQFDRAVDIARPFLEAGFPVCMGGFHVSGTIAMFPDLTPEVRTAQEMGISLFAGEAENGRLDQVIRDAWAGRLAPLYDYLNDLPGLENEPTPFLPRAHTDRIQDGRSSFDLGRGCPYQCSFCTIINVQGRKSRYRSPDDVERFLRENHALGIRRAFITDDDFARNRNWEALLDRIISLRAEGLVFGLTVQIDTQAHRLPGFIEKLAKAGVTHAFIGLENINPDSLLGAKKRQNKITDYRAFLQKLANHDIISVAGYITGFPGDSKTSILRDIEIIKRELPVDILSIYFLTPLPGSEDHKKARERGDWMDADLNKYDVQHRVSHHATMSDAEWEEAFQAAWANYYTDEHLRTVLRRAAARSSAQLKVLASTFVFYGTAREVEGLHPFETGPKRMIFREDRRPGLPLEEPVVFDQRVRRDAAAKVQRWKEVRGRAGLILAEVMAASDRLSYVDQAITPQREEEFDALDLYHATHGGEAALARMRRDDAIRLTGHAPAAAL